MEILMYVLTALFVIVGGGVAIWTLVDTKKRERVQEGSGRNK
jgi:hypothetical protein